MSESPGSPSESVAEHRKNAPSRMAIAILTISDTRTRDTDKSGNWIAEEIIKARHIVAERLIVPDQPDEIRERVSAILKLTPIDVIILTGGTGITSRDQTPEAVKPLLDVEMPGFGELFRYLGYAEIGPAAMLSRAFAGRIGNVIIYSLPGSTAAVRLAIEKLILPELGHLVHHARG